MLLAPKHSTLYMLLTWTSFLFSVQVFSDQLVKMHGSGLVKDEAAHHFLSSDARTEESCHEASQLIKALVDSSSFQQSGLQPFTYKHARVYFPRFESGSNVRVSFPPDFERDESLIVASMLELSKGDLDREGFGKDLWTWALKHNVELRFIRGWHEELTLSETDSKHIVHVNLHTSGRYAFEDSGSEHCQSFFGSLRLRLFLSERQSAIREGLVKLALRYRLEEWLNGESVSYRKVRIHRALIELRALGLLSQEIDDDKEHELQQLVSSMALAIISRSSLASTDSTIPLHPIGDLGLYMSWYEHSTQNLTLSAPEFMAIYQSLMGVVSPIFLALYPTSPSPQPGNQ